MSNNLDYLSGGTKGFEIMKKINIQAYKAEKAYLDKVREYNRGLFELKNNIQKITLPTEEAKLKAAEQIKKEKDNEPKPPITDYDKAIEEKQLEKDIERQKKLNAETHGLIKTLTKKLSGGFNALIKKLISLNNEGKISTDSMLKTLVELNDSSKVSANTAKILLNELSVNADRVGDSDIDSSEKTLKELIAELSDNTNNINVELETISKLLKESNINSKTSADILTEIKDNGKITTDTQEKLYKEMIDKADTHGKEIKILLNKLNQQHILPSYTSGYRTESLGSVFTDNEQLVEDMVSEIENNNFYEVFGRDINYGITRDNNGNTIIGSTKVNLKYNTDNGLVDIKFGENSIPFSVEGFIELFAQKNMPRLLKITKQDFDNYADIIKLTNMNNYNIDNEKENKLIIPIKKAIDISEPKPNTRGNTIEKTIENNLYTLYHELLNDQQKTGQGLNTIILPSSAKELKKELILIIASIKAGNNSTDMKNKASAIIDQLRNKKKISQIKEKELLTLLINDQ